MRNLILLIIFICFSLCFAADTADSQKVEVTKEITKQDGLYYTITVSFRRNAGVQGTISQVILSDSLPEELDLVSGDLVKKGANVRKYFFSLQK